MSEEHKGKSATIKSHNTIVWADLQAVVQGKSVIFYHGGNVLATDHINDGDITLQWFGSGGSNVGLLVVGTIHGNEHDLSYGYAISDYGVLRSPLWRDVTAGPLNLTNLPFSSPDSYTIDGRGSMSYSLAGGWTCTAGPGARLDGASVQL